MKLNPGEWLDDMPDPDLSDFADYLREAIRALRVNHGSRVKLRVKWHY